MLGLVKFSWSSIAISLFDYAIESKQPVFHLWGHSWEIDKYNLWGELELFLQHVYQYNVRMVTNKDLVKETLL